jgi:hypothetical protein
LAPQACGFSQPCCQVLRWMAFLIWSVLVPSSSRPLECALALAAG